MVTFPASSDDPVVLSAEHKRHLLDRYRGNQRVWDLTYGTVKDFCDSSEHLPFLSRLQGDLKDLQRPAAFKAIVGLLPPCSRLLEVGAGEPHVAHALSELGYDVSVVDPYDGSGNGPTEFQRYVGKYPRVRILRDVFTDELEPLEPGAFDCIYSISVLEHVHQPALSSLFRGIRRFVKPGGYSLHLIDHVLKGEGEEFHLLQLAEILTLQSDLGSKSPAQATVDTVTLLNRTALDLDTYYLSAEGHNAWRGKMPYERFPFRKVVSIHSCTRRSAVQL